MTSQQQNGGQLVEVRWHRVDDPPASRCSPLSSAAPSRRPTLRPATSAPPTPAGGRPPREGELVTRAAIYARVSTAEQVDGTSLSTQVQRCEHYTPPTTGRSPAGTSTKACPAPKPAGPPWTSS